MQATETYHADVLALSPREKVFTMVGTLLALFLAAPDEVIG